MYAAASWYLGLLGLPVVLALIPNGILAAIFLVRGEYRPAELAKEWKWVLLFLLAFLLMLEVRYVNPSISYAEKFMDHAFIASIMRDPVVPPLDPWFAGGRMDVYYYFGYWILGALGLSSGVPSNYVFNLALPTVFALGALNLYSLGKLLLRRFQWLPLAAFVLVNPSFLYQVFQGKEIGAVFWDSTRTITNTINEYPLFSFLWGDVHAHVIGIFNQLFLLVVLVIAWKRWGSLDRKGRIILGAVAAVSLGAMPLVNSWDILIYAPVVLLFGFMIALEEYRRKTVSAGGGAMEAQGNGPGSRIPGGAGKAAKSGDSGFFPDGSGPAESPSPEEEYPKEAARRGFRAQLPFEKMVKGFAGKIRPFASSCWFMVAVPAAAILLYLPYYIQMKTAGFQGIFLVKSPSVPLEFVLVNGFFIAIIIAYVIRDIGKRPYLLAVPVVVALAGYPAAAIAVIPLVYLILRKKRDPAEIFAIIGLSILVFCEFLYLADHMGDIYFRMNTVFKLYLPAWLFLGSAALAMAGRFAEHQIAPGRPPRPIRRIATIAVVAALFIAPVFIPLNSPYGSTWSLDGLAYLRTAHPGDAAAVDFLRMLPGKEILVEAETFTTGDYSYNGRVSSFTGIPAVLGWPFHEVMWRGSEGDWYTSRLGDIRLIYEDPARRGELLARYNVTLLYVGDLERDQFRVDMNGSGLRKIYDEAGVQIYRPI